MDIDAMNIRLARLEDFAKKVQPMFDAWLAQNPGGEQISQELLDAIHAPLNGGPVAEENNEEGDDDAPESDDSLRSRLIAAAGPLDETNTKVVNAATGDALDQLAETYDLKRK